MIEENVVSAAGSSNLFNAKEMQEVIKEAGFVPGRRNQKYEFINPLTAEGRGENFWESLSQIFKSFTLRFSTS